MSAAAAGAGTRRSLLHDVLSHAEVVELGLDGSVDDLPPLTTRLSPSCARVVVLFAWFYFLAFWGAVAAAVRHVIAAHAETLLPGPEDFIFVAVSTVLLVSAEFGVYCHLKIMNPVSINNGPMGNLLSPTPCCSFTHFMLSATSRFCTFLEFLFLLHAWVLPLPLLACAAFTVSTTVGALPFLLQLRCLLSCLFGDFFDPLRFSTCIPTVPLERLLLRCSRLCLAGVAKGARGALWHLRRARERLRGLLRRGAAVSPGRRVDISCCDFGSDSSSSSSSSSSRARQASSSCQANIGGAAAVQLLQGEGPLHELGAPLTVLKEPLAYPGQSQQGEGECPYTPAEGDAAPGGSGSFAVSSCGGSTTAEWRPNEQQLQQPPAVHTPQELENLSSSSHCPDATIPFSYREETASSQGRPLRPPETPTRPPAPQFISPRAALVLANCLFLLDLPGLTLHVKASFLPLQQLEAHEFLSSLVSLV
ncbi:uncharacterized protein EMH_0062610 [Eimeria mitis]|uniref:Uncharacterized protein n=1 Tax=Eimeria mitis TaxID=44415 RepID=U6K644_9EIME|nr:uncharacterized protein EMH_0062610 [Eimeria mitis]CDJ30943.1 hypothetical protein, conserved [Eimeria mitis]